MAEKNRLIKRMGVGGFFSSFSFFSFSLGGVGMGGGDWGGGGGDMDLLLQ